jgi:hypothetical protein
VPELTFIFEIQNLTGGNNSEIGTPSQFTLTVTNDDFVQLQYRTKDGVNGLWSSASTWETSDDGVNWIDATEPPSFESATITIRSGTVVRVQSDIAVDELIIESGGILLRQTQGLTIEDGPGDDILVQGILRHANTSEEPIFAAGANIRVEADARIDVIANNGNPSVYGTSTQVDWESGAIFNWISDQPINSGTYFPNVSEADLVFMNLRTNVVAQGLDNQDLLINGSVRIVTGNTYTFGGTGSKTVRNGFRSGGDLIQEAGSGPIVISGNRLTGASTVFGTDGGTFFLNDTQGYRYLLPPMLYTLVIRFLKEVQLLLMVYFA